VHEIKHDGYRVQAHFDGEPRIYTRRGNEWAARMPTIAGALKALPANNLVLDGELVALDRTVKPSFYRVGLNLIRYTEHLDGDGATVLEHACKLGLEGIVSKRADAPYRSGTRPAWVKTNCDAGCEANNDRWEMFEP
jgi:bifunctional non-homologous end joining protein LigD